jgi:hypothetical protein
VNAGHLDIIPKTSVGIVMSIIVNGVHRTIINITILTEVLLNGIHMTIIYITILTENLLNGVHRTIIYNKNRG